MLNSSKRDSRHGNRKNIYSEIIQSESKLELDGMIMDVLIMIVPITGKDGNVDTVMVTIRNISDLKAAEKLRMENLALEEASKIKNDFLTGMSHELRTPLNAIIGYSEMLRDHAYGEQNAEQVKKIDVILSCGNSLLGVISDILGLSVTKNLVEMLGGTIRVTSDEGKGSKFSFMVPERINIVTGKLLPDDKTQQNCFGLEE